MRNGLATQILPGRFRESELVARGAMGDVYRAVDVLLGRVVAVKVLSEAYAHDESAHQRFAREARAAASLAGDPNIVTVYDITDAGGRPCIVMEFLGGGSLETLLRREGAPPPERALRWLDEAGRALDHAHAAGVVHRDVKPGNLLLDDEGVVHVADFGIASAAGAASLTESGTLIGTAGYLSPEQAAGEPTSPASDRYALGVVAYELLAGARPFVNDSPAAEAAAHVHAPVPSLHGRNDLPPALDAVFARALAKSPGKRYRSCGELVAALRSAFEGRSAASTLVLPGAAVAPRQRRRARAGALLALGGALLAAVLAIALTGSSSRPAARERVAARHANPPVSARPPATTRPYVPPATRPPTGSTLSERVWELLRQGRLYDAIELMRRYFPQLVDPRSLDPYGAYG
jgi:serine/threonine-protein kinase